MERMSPRPTRNSAFFWEGLREGKLLIQECSGCETVRFPPRPMCPHCHSLEWSAKASSGRGTLCSWAKPVHPPLPMFEPGYLVALIDLEEGIRLLSNLCDVEESAIEIGMPVEVFFAKTADDGAVHQFRPAQEGKA